MTVRRKRGRPRKAPATLPTIDVGGGASAGDPEAARAALAAADAGSADGAIADLETDGDGNGVPAGYGAPPGKRLANLPPASAPSTNGKHDPPSAPTNRVHAKLDAAGESPTGRQYRNLKRDQLAVLLAKERNDNRELKQRLATTAPIAQGVIDAGLQTFVAETLGSFHNLLALYFGDTAKLKPADKTRLGELGGPAVAPYVGEMAEKAPLATFCVALLSVETEIVLHLKTERDARRARERFEAPAPVSVAVPLG